MISLECIWFLCGLFNIITQRRRIFNFADSHDTVIVCLKLMVVLLYCIVFAPFVFIYSLFCGVVE